jgi:tRNA nucleotidyltransferase (CCA-adding enzyme)
VSKQHLLVHRALELRPTTLLKLLESVDAFRKPERFEQLLLACEADMRGRTGLEAAPYPAANYLREAQRVAAAISAQHVEPGHEGKAIGERIRILRTEALDTLKKSLRAD